MTYKAAIDAVRALQSTDAYVLIKARGMEVTTEAYDGLHRAEVAYERASVPMHEFRPDAASWLAVIGPRGQLILFNRGLPATHKPKEGEA